MTNEIKEAASIDLTIISPPDLYISAPTDDTVLLVGGGKDWKDDFASLAHMGWRDNNVRIFAADETENCISWIAHIIGKPKIAILNLMDKKFIDMAILGMLSNMETIVITDDQDIKDVCNVYEYKSTDSLLNVMQMITNFDPN